MANSRLIALCGLAGSGKSTVAQYVLESQFDFVSVSFAQPLKQMLAALGLSDPQLYGDLKATPSPLLCGRTPRWAMQTLGTEWGRDLIGDAIWTNAWRQAVRDALVQGRSVITDDLRFKNESLAVASLGGKIWRITRPGLAEQLHQSELEQRFIKADVEFANTGSIEELQELVDGALAGDGE